ncbi:MAG: DUF1804 family protein [Bacteroidales bacterium]
MTNKKRSANNSQLHTLAEKMYVEECLSAKAIAESLSISAQTVGRWKAKKDSNSENWDDKRARFKREPYNIRKLINEELARLTRGEEQTLDMKAINEAIKAQEAISKGVSCEAVYTVFREFDVWMSQHDAELAVKFTEWHKQFLILKAQEESA